MTQKQHMNHLPLVTRIARISAVAYALFLSIFALDVFEPGLSTGQVLVALGIHLLPSLVILLFLWIAWKNPIIGGLLFILVGIAYIIEAGGQAFLTYLLIAGIPILIGLLFLWGYRLARKV